MSCVCLDVILIHKDCDVCTLGSRFSPFADNALSQKQQNQLIFCRISEKVQTERNENLVSIFMKKSCVGNHMEVYLGDDRQIG
jgi:hypothetical protein